MSKKVFWTLMITLIAVLFVSFFANFVLVTVISLKNKNLFENQPAEFEETLVDGSNKNSKRIAVININGIISYNIPGAVGDSMVDDINFQLDQALRDKTIGAIILKIDSPGGEITASDALYHKVLETNAKKPVLAYFNSLGASGAYYTSLGAQYLMANELSLTGSIGVMLQTVNYQQLTDFLGLKFLTFKSGKMKDMLNPSRPPTEEELQYVQGMVEESFLQFINIVSSRRKISTQLLMQTVGDGRVLSGKRALTYKLIDATGYITDAYQKARKLAKLPKDAPIIQYTAPFSFSDLIPFIGKAQESPQVNINLSPISLKLEPGKFYYLSPHLFN